MKSFPVIIFVFIFLICNFSFGENIDLIVMVDISASMEPYFDQVVSYFLNDLLVNNISIGDNFYFLIFSSSAEYYGELKIDNNPESIETVINKIKLIKPVALHTDLVGAVQSLYEFSIALDQNTPKLILLLTDGLHDPPLNSKYDLDRREVTQIMRNLGSNMKRDRWIFKIIKFPRGSADSTDSDSIGQNSNITEDLSNDTDYLDILAEESDSNIIEYKQEDNLNDKLTDSLNIIESEIPVLRNNNVLPDVYTDVHPEEDKDTETNDNITFNLNNLLVDISLNPVFIFIVAFIIFFILVYLIIHKYRMKSTVSKVIKKTAYKKKKKGGSEQIEMRVQTQNHKIGFRNIHQISKNKYKTVGGGNSAFLIFFIKFPSHIAELHWDGKYFSFIPVKDEFFPEVNGMIKNCLKKDIPAKSKKGHRIIINFFEYISPLDEINNIFNRVLNSYY